MKTYNWDITPGFGVMHKFKHWQIAYHMYDPKVNGINALNNWGAHLDTDEAFILLEGQATLATAGTGKTPTDMKVRNMEKNLIYLVETGCWHAIALLPTSKVIIFENNDTTNTVQYHMSVKESNRIGKSLK